MVPYIVFVGLLASFMTQGGAAAVTGAQELSPPLRIVVIAGEDAVNVIQQKTAVAPIVEVRDRNNLPVAGATVTFSVGQGASFGGVSTLTVATNAAGQAVATGLTPTVAGSIQIQATALFQGQTAIATIAQANVVTAAQAAAASAASSGAATGGGGGISGTTLGVAGGAVGAAVVGIAVASGGGSDVPPTSVSTAVPATTVVAPPVITATPQPTTTVYSGPWETQFTNSLTTVCEGATETCVSVWREVGTLRLTLTRGSGDTLTGNADLTSTQQRVSTSCPQYGTDASGQGSRWNFALTGTVQSFGFEDHLNIGSEFLYRFVLRASLNNDVITGTVRTDETYMASASPYCQAARSESSWTTPFSLRK